MFSFNISPWRQVSPSRDLNPGLLSNSPLGTWPWHWDAPSIGKNGWNWWTSMSIPPSSTIEFGDFPNKTSIDRVVIFHCYVWWWESIQGGVIFCFLVCQTSFGSKPRGNKQTSFGMFHVFNLPNIRILNQQTYGCQICWNVTCFFLRSMICNNYEFFVFSVNSWNGD